MPTIMVVGASNRLPEEDALAALFDRFLMRVPCENVPGEHLGEVLQAGWRLDLGLHDQPSGMDIEDVRRLHRQLPRADLSSVRAPLVDLISRLRQAGIAISDRRAVKLQRLIAASALLSGRLDARLSDLWVFRYIWDTVEQQEVLASVVHETLAKVPIDSADHPRARGDESPDPEALARDLEELAKQLNEAADGQRAAVSDRLGILASRCQWVKDQRQRTILLERVEKLWPQLKSNP